MGSNNERTNSRRACDGCRIRKVKCNGFSPCAQCGHLGLRCTYDRPSANRKPAIRNRIIKQLRQTNGREVAESPTDEDGDAAVGAHAAAHHDTKAASNANAAVTTTTKKNRTYSSGEYDSFSPFTSQPNLEPNYTQGFFTALIPDFEELVFPVQPISSGDEIRAAIANMHDSLGDAALVYAFAAVTINQNRASWISSSQDCAPRVLHLIRLCLRAHRQAQANSDSEVLSEVPFLAKRVVTCVFMAATLLAFNRMDRAFTILREAITLFQNITYGAGPHDKGELKMTVAEEARSHRLHWILFIHERFLSLVSGYPTILPDIDTANLQRALVDLAPHVQAGFRSLISLFRIVDEEFLAGWVSQRGSMSSLMAAAHKSHKITAEWIQYKQTQLDEDEARATQYEQDLLNNSKGPLTEFQRVDLSITRLWLRTLLWQLALAEGLLTSVVAPLPHRNHDGLQLQFPARRLSRQLGSLVSTLETVDSVSAHGCGILQKLFEITSSAADVLSLPLPGGNGAAARADVTSPSAVESDVNYVKDLVLSIYFLLGMNSVDAGKRQYLLAKLELLQERFPDVDFRSVGAEGAERSQSTGQPSPVAHRT